MNIKLPDAGGKLTSYRLTGKFVQPEEKEFHWPAAGAVPSLFAHAPLTV